MKKSILFIIYTLTCIPVVAQIPFEEYFTANSLRLDFIQTVCSDTSYYSLNQIKQESYWGGSHTHLLDTFFYGTNMIMVYDSASNNLIYSRGYATLCSEWQTTDEAKQFFRSFEETVILPYPRKTVKIVIQLRDKNNIFHPIFQRYINPSSYMILKENYNLYKFSVLQKKGDPANKVDIVFLPEFSIILKLNPTSQTLQR